MGIFEVSEANRKAKCMEIKAYDYMVRFEKVFNGVEAISNDFDSMNLRASAIKNYVLEHMGLKVSSLYIAQVKQKCGIIERENYNPPKSENFRQPKCPLDDYYNLDVIISVGYRVKSKRGT